MRNNIERRFRRESDDSQALVVYRTPPPPLAPSAPAETIPFGNIASAIKRQIWVVVLLAVLGGAAGLLYTYFKTPVYEARVVVEVHGLNENFLQMNALDPLTTDVNLAHLQTQIRLLQNSTLMERVYDRLGLERVPELQPKAARAVSGPAASAAGSRTPKDDAVSIMLSRLAVDQIGATQLLEIKYLAYDPALAAQISNSIAEEYIRQNREEKWAAVQRTGAWLTEQLGDMKRRLEDSEVKLQHNATNAGLLFSGERASIDEERLKQIQEELSRAYASRVAKQSDFEMVNKGSIESLPEVVNDPTLRNYELKLTELKQQLTEASANLTPEHYKVRRLSAQIAELETTLSQGRARIVARLRSEYEAAQRREAALAASFRSQSSRVTEQAFKAVQYNLLKREVDTNRELYETVLRRVKEAGVTTAMRASNVRVVEPARTPASPAGPSSYTGPLAGCVCGLLTGIGFAAIRRNRDRIESPGEVAAQLRIPELGVIPQLASVPARSRVQIDLSTKPGLQSYRDPTLIEPFRATATSLLRAAANTLDARTIAVTSPNPRDGKTTIVTNLASILASAGRRVLMIDADLRCPRLHKVHEVDQRPGLLDVLRGQKRWEECVHPTAHPGLSLMPSGIGFESVPDPFLSGGFAGVLNVASRHFDTVIVDTPPLLAVSDARVVSALCDGAIVVVSSGITEWSALTVAVQQLRQDDVHLLGMVLNKWDSERYPAGSHASSSAYVSTSYAANRNGSRAAGA